MTTPGGDNGATETLENAISLYTHKGKSASLDPHTGNICAIFDSKDLFTKDVADNA